MASAWIRVAPSWRPRWNVELNGPARVRTVIEGGVQNRPAASVGADRRPDPRLVCSSAQRACRRPSRARQRGGGGGGRGIAALRRPRRRGGPGRRAALGVETEVAQELDGAHRQHRRVLPAVAVEHAHVPGEARARPAGRRVRRSRRRRAFRPSAMAATASGPGQGASVGSRAIDQPTLEPAGRELRANSRAGFFEQQDLVSPAVPPPRTAPAPRRVRPPRGGFRRQWRSNRAASAGAGAATSGVAGASGGSPLSASASTTERAPAITALGE